MNWNEMFWYDESSPSCLRYKNSVYFGNSDSILKIAAGEPVGGFQERLGYYCTKQGGKFLRCHRIIWEMHNGPIPEGKVIDHIDQDSRNNRIGNLRCVTSALNSRNTKRHITNVSGIVGTYLVTKESCGKLYNYWVARWVDLEHVPRAKLFSVQKLGNDEAKRAATEYRKERIAEMNTKGAGYTELHGVNS